MKNAAFSLILFLCSTVSAQVNIDLNGLRIGIHEHTGGIVSMEHESMGRFLADDGGGWLFDLACPVEEYVPLRSSISNSQAQIIKITDGVEIQYASLKLSRDIDTGGDIRAVVKITAAKDGQSVVMNCLLENNSKIPVRQIIFPDIRGLKPFDGRDNVRLKMARGEVFPFLLSPRQEHTAPFYAIKTGWNHYPAKGFSYGPNCLRWLDFGSLKGGLSIYQKRWREGERPDIRTYMSDQAPRSLRLCWEHYEKIGELAAVEPGKTWESGDFVLTPHRGSWAKGIEPYREFVRQVNPQRFFEVPEHITHAAAYQTIWMIEHHETQPEKAYFTYKDFPEIAREAKEYGIPEIVVWGWYNKGFTLPFETNPLLGAEEEFISGIKDARRMGVNIVPFVSCQIIHRDDMARYGKTEVQPDSEYTYHHELIPPFNPAYAKEFAFSGAGIEPDNEQWQADVADSFEYWFEKGVASFSWDVFGFWQTEYKKPLMDLARRLRTAARRVDPAATFSAETVAPAGLEWDGQVLDYTWNWTCNMQGDYVAYIDAGPILNILKGIRLNCLVEDSPLTAMQAFADGLILTVIPRRPGQTNGSALLSSQPELAETVRSLSKRRMDFIDYFEKGIFIGDGILSQKSWAFVRAHLLDRKLLMIVLNTGRDPLRETVTLCPELWLKKGAYRLSCSDLSGTPKPKMVKTVPSDNFLQLELKPLEMLFIEWVPADTAQLTGGGALNLSFFEVQLS